MSASLFKKYAYYGTLHYSSVLLREYSLNISVFMARAKSGDTVQLHNKGTLTDATVYDTTVGPMRP